MSLAGIRCMHARTPHRVPAHHCPSRCCIQNIWGASAPVYRPDSTAVRCDDVPDVGELWYWTRRRIDDDLLDNDRTRTDDHPVDSCPG